MTSTPIVHEAGAYYAVRHLQGYEVYRNGTTAATRVATIGFLGDEGLNRAITEIDRRIALDRTKAKQEAPTERITKR